MKIPHAASCIRRPVAVNVNIAMSSFAGLIQTQNGIFHNVITILFENVNLQSDILARAYEASNNKLHHNEQLLYVKMSRWNQQQVNEAPVQVK